MMSKFKHLKLTLKKMRANKNIWYQKCNNKLIESWEILLCE